jgi:hypothetical protein
MEAGTSVRQLDASRVAGQAGEEEARQAENEVKSAKCAIVRSLGTATLVKCISPREKVPPKLRHFIFNCAIASRMAQFFIHLI